jgi:hypothetical protein
MPLQSGLVGRGCARRGHEQSGKKDDKDSLHVGLGCLYPDAWPRVHRLKRQIVQMFERTFLSRV